MLQIKKEKENNHYVGVAWVYCWCIGCYFVVNYCAIVSYYVVLSYPDKVKYQSFFFKFWGMFNLGTVVKY